MLHVQGVKQLVYLSVIVVVVVVHLIYKIKHDVAQNIVYTSAVFQDVTKYKIISDT